MSDRQMPDFVAGFASRHDQAGAALRRAFAAKGVAFSPRDMTPEPPPAPDARPRHFEPADRQEDPTEGWDPFDTTQQPSGFVDPIATAKALGYEEGVAAAMAQIAANTARDRALIDGLTAAINDDRRIDRDRLAGHLRQTVMELVRQLVAEAGIDAGLLNRRVVLAAGMLADDAESAVLRLNPEDMPLVDGHLPSNIFAAGDIKVERGHFVLESAATIVEDGPDLWIEQLAQAIDRAALPE
ncbi:flagellar assembly protein FliH [Sphingomonas pruni]|jgi:flagellar assembly protein FliH|nr:flagellar assembly protein FliH [Sphingomonas pruni]